MNLCQWVNRQGVFFNHRKLTYLLSSWQFIFFLITSASAHPAHLTVMPLYTYLFTVVFATVGERSENWLCHRHFVDTCCFAICHSWRGARGADNLNNNTLNHPHSQTPNVPLMTHGLPRRVTSGHSPLPNNAALVYFYLTNFITACHHLCHHHTRWCLMTLVPRVVYLTLLHHIHCLLSFTGEWQFSPAHAWVVTRWCLVCLCLSLHSLDLCSSFTSAE